MGKELSVQFEHLPEREPSILKVSLIGNLLYQQAVDLKALVDKNLEAETRGVIFDLTQLVIIDSYGLGVLAGLQFHMTKSKRRLVLFGLNSHLMGVFRMSGMADLFILVDTEQEALNRIRQF